MNSMLSPPVVLPTGVAVSFTGGAGAHLPGRNRGALSFMMEAGYGSTSGRRRRPDRRAKVSQLSSVQQRLSVDIDLPAFQAFACLEERLLHVGTLCIAYCPATRILNVCIPLFRWRNTFAGRYAGGSTCSLPSLLMPFIAHGMRCHCHRELNRK